MRWENSKRLIYGSLVCLSPDGFNSFLFATVANRDADKLREGIIDVTIETNVEIQFNVPHTMVESSSYFESYRHVLKSLQAMNENNLPFQRYIVGEKPKEEDDDLALFRDINDNEEKKVFIDTPRYLRNSLPKYDLTPLMKKKYKNLGKDIDILADGKWPIQAFTSLDDSQYAAVKNALTKEISIVQGPPGTGKTYIGLKIAQVLLAKSNSQYWNRRDRPILVICYTNHALDQFLEEILKFNDNIVRVGSRSKVEALQKYNVSNLKRDPKIAYPRDMRTNFAKIRERMTSLTEQMNQVSVRIEATKNYVLTEAELEPFMGAALDKIENGIHAVSGEWMSTGKSKSLIEEWLGLGRTIMDQPLEEEMDNMNIEVDHEEEEVAAEENIDIEEDAQNELERRMLDLDDEPNKDIVNELRQSKERAMKNVAFVDFPDENAGENQGGGWQISKKELKRRKKKVKQELLKDTTADRFRLRFEADPWGLDRRETAL